MAEATREFVHAECQAWLESQPESSVHCCVTDAPYGLKFMGKRWDYDVPSVEMWAALLRVLKPGGSLLCFAGTRTQHRMAVNIEDAGFRLVDTLMWIHGEGFAKGGDVGKYIDEKLGAEREVVGPAKYAGRAGAKRATYAQDEWTKANQASMGETETAPATPEAKRFDGYKTQLKPAYEPIILAMKPNEGSYAENALKHGVAGLNVDACRVPGEPFPSNTFDDKMTPFGGTAGMSNTPHTETRGRYPPNLLHDGSEEVLAGFPEAKSTGPSYRHAPATGLFRLGPAATTPLDKGSGSAARFFPSLGWTEDEPRFYYTAKASKGDRGDGNSHPTVKPVKLMRWLVRLVCPPGGTVLDPFMGSGTTAVACHVERLNFIGVEREAESVEIARNRVQQQCSQVMLEL